MGNVVVEDDDARRNDVLSGRFTRTRSGQGAEPSRPGSSLKPNGRLGAVLDGDVVGEGRPRAVGRHCRHDALRAERQLCCGSIDVSGRRWRTGDPERFPPDRRAVPGDDEGALVDRSGLRKQHVAWVGDGVRHDGGNHREQAESHGVMLPDATRAVQ